MRPIRHSTSGHEQEGQRATPTDDQLIEGIARGEMAALAELVRRYQHDLLRLAFRLTQSWEDAEDIVQEGFLRVPRGSSRYRTGTSAKSWLYRIVVNLCMDEARRRRRRRAATPARQAGTAPDPPGRAAQSESAEAVRRAVAGLPDRQRTVVVLRRYHELPNAAISQITGWSESAVESLMTRALANLRQSLGAHEEKVIVSPQVRSRQGVE